MPVEGVTKFTARHRAGPFPPGRYDEQLAALAAWRSVIAGLGGIGQDPARYDGAGYGNVSLRTGPFPGERGRRAFLITGSQTGGLSCVEPAHFCRVTACDVEENRVDAEGPAAPSSESLTHGAVYDLSPHIRAVVHVHCPAIFDRAQRLGLPATPPDVDYGTVAMARHTQRLWRETTLPERRAFVMAGHEDGVVTLGKTLAEAGERAVRLLAEALALNFSVEGAVCRPAPTTTLSPRS